MEMNSSSNPSVILMLEENTEITEDVIDTY